MKRIGIAVLALITGLAAAGGAVELNGLKAADVAGMAETVSASKPKCILSVA